MTSIITNLVPGKRAQRPDMPCLVLKRQVVEQLLRERAERVDLRCWSALIQVRPAIHDGAQAWDYDWRVMNGPDSLLRGREAP
jgi:hypothetical protein